MPTTTPGSDNEFPKLLLLEGAAPAAPASGRVKLYAKTDGLLYWKDDAGTEYAVGIGDLVGTGDLAGHTGDTSDAHDASAISIADAGTYFSGTDVEAALQELGAGGGGGSDPIAALFGAPDTAYEFASSSLTGLTAMGTADAEDADTTIAGHLYLADNDGSMVGRYAAVNDPCTIIVKITEATARYAYQYVGAFCGEATPGKLVWVGLYSDGATPQIAARTFATPADGGPGSPSIGTVPQFTSAHAPWWVAIVVNSDTDVDYYVSRTGEVFYPVLLAHNNSMTVGSAGVAVTCYGGGPTSQGAFDYIRIWNSALTIPSFT